jgi:hypothetical protein
MEQQPCLQKRSVSPKKIDRFQFIAQVPSTPIQPKRQPTMRLAEIKEVKEFESPPSKNNNKVSSKMQDQHT